VYWQALLRDVPFAEFRDGTDNRDVLAACEELSRLSDFRGPKANGRVTPGTCSAAACSTSTPADRTGRAVTPPGVLDGPWSRSSCSATALRRAVDRARIRTTTPASEFLTEYDEWLRAQNGEAPRGQLRFDPTPRYIAPGGTWRSPSGRADAGLGGADAARHPAAGPDPRYGRACSRWRSRHEPHRTRTAGRETSPRARHLRSTTCKPCSRGDQLRPRAAYWQKWFVHRTLRPEAYGGLAHHRLANGVATTRCTTTSCARRRSTAPGRSTGTYLLSQTTPRLARSSPPTPAAARAIGGVTATLLKAFFDESRCIADPVQPDPRDPTRLVPYSGPPLTVAGDSTSWGANLRHGRNWMGIHWCVRRRRCDGDRRGGGDRPCCATSATPSREAFDGFTLTRFRRQPVTV
jgi:hypothetical protein